ncbi:GAF domain-containing protein [Oscillatoriales cyanobacterium LEGE 11467]|uniref:histidine kinase n=2 Tax=Zarconia TaxID=2992130 RepID=A0A928Z7Z9_9CYAN|nr:GAF domain-containing protein [Zarconia navalis LEGE 11467]
MSGFEPSKIPKHRLSEVVPEPVCFAGSIQPHGVLLALSIPERVVVQVSANIQDYFDISPQDLLGRPLSVLLDETEIEAIDRELKHAGHLNKSSARINRDQQHFHITAYRTATAIVLELEPASIQLDARQMHARVNQAIAQLRRVPDLTEFLQTAAATVRGMTEFDRVMVYQFDSQGAGAVVAEAKRDDLPPYLGLHYPATDIPEPIRELYRRGLVRYIPDLSAPWVEFISTENSIAVQPLDLSSCVLRGVDPCCVEYHRNMGVAAILVIALVRGDTLWGLISCHHQTPKFIDGDVRESCQILGQLIASELANKVNTEELDELTRLRSLLTEFIQSIAEVDDLKQALVNPAPRLLDLVSAQGAAVCLEDEITRVGQTPSQDRIREIVDWIETQPSFPSSFSLPASAPDNVLFCTDSLPKIYQAAEAFKDSASGLLALQISKVRRYTILWFRPEVLQTVNWAGDPNTSLTVAADGSVTLCPRQSFDRWQEIVRFTSLPWKHCELENALNLRSAIVGIVLKGADELARVNQELERSNRELDSFAYAASHDLKEPLRGIHNYSNLLLRGYSEVLDDVGRSRLRTLTRLTRRMETLIDALLKFSRLGQAELNIHPTDLDRLLHQVLEELSIGRPHQQAEIRIPRSLPTVHCDSVLMRDVLVNLLSNALKYNDKSQRWIEIGYIESESETARQGPEASKNLHPEIFYVRDNGIGIRERHLDRIFSLFKRLHEQHLYGGGTGAGLTIAKKIIEHHGGRIWVESTDGEGSTFYFTLN